MLMRISTEETKSTEIFYLGRFMIALSFFCLFANIESLEVSNESLLERSPDIEANQKEEREGALVSETADPSFSEEAASQERGDQNASPSLEEGSHSRHTSVVEGDSEREDMEKVSFEPEEPASSSVEPLYELGEDRHCYTSTRSNQVWVRHLEPKGVGFNQGYTTLEGFVMANKTYFGVFPYIDARWHIFNNGKNAANIGVGARGFSKSRIFGANIYYDYRKITDGSFNQVSLGFETIGRVIDVYANGYIVVGQKNTDSYDNRFYRFQGHHLLLKGKKQGALSGWDASLRFHLLQKEKWDCYADLGPYYYHGSRDSLFGGKVGIGAILSNYFFLESTLSYDHMFQWIGQAIGGFRFSFGGKTDTSYKSRSCSKTQVLTSRLMQIPKHNEIIVVDDRSSIDFAINPLTGQPYFFWFVDNLSSSLGTYESPYPTLKQAQIASSPYDIIYAYTGDGTSNGMDQGIVLKDYQRLWGAGFSYSLPTTRGEISIPALDSGYPKITNISGAGVNLANFNTVSGIHVDRAFSYGILGIGAAQADIFNNVITDINQSGSQGIEGNIVEKGGIHLEGPGMQGVYHVLNNTILTNDPGLQMTGIIVAPGDSDVCHVDLVENNVQTFLKSAAMIQSLDSSHLTSSVSSNIFFSVDSSSLYLSHEDSSRHEFSLGNNRYTSANAAGCFILGKGSFSIGDGTVSNSQFMNSDIGLHLRCELSSPVLSCRVEGNTFSNNQTRHLQAETTGNNQEVVCLRVIRNTCTTTAPSGDFYLRNEFTNLFNLIEFSKNIPNTYIDGTPPGSDPIFSLPFCGIPD